MQRESAWLSRKIHCRTGSLEKKPNMNGMHGWIHCRTGSLEKLVIQRQQLQHIHCRTGSLETARALGRRRG